MRIVAARQDVIDAGEGDRQVEGARVEIHGVIVELLEVFAGVARDVGAAIVEGFEAAIQSFGEIRDRAAQVA